MAETFFKNKKAVHAYLQEHDWQIGRSQFYAHCKEGLLRPVMSGENKGLYALSAVEKYAHYNCRRAETGIKESDREAQAREEKAEFERDKERVKLAREEFELDKAKGKFIARSEFDLAIVGRAVAFMAHLNHTIQQEVQDWIDLVEGNQDRAPELVDAISKSIEQRMGDFAADAEFDVILEANQ